VKGLLVTLEGIDGSGKSTVSHLLKQSLTQTWPGRRFIFTAEPTKGETGAILRSRLSKSRALEDEVSKARRMGELFLFMADHADHLSHTIIPSMQTGAIIVSDRYTDSTAAYQGVTLRGIVPDPVEWIRSLYRPWNVSPDLTIFFSIDPSRALKRIVSRQIAEKFERAEFLREVDGNFRRIASLEPERFAIVDAGREIDDVAKDALSLICALIERSA
jgi:dTMP kinase